jgi:hypothetical protein
MKIHPLFYKPLFSIGILILIVLAITSQSILRSPKTFEPNGITYTHYNNYIIFKQSYFHLIENKDLYTLYPNEHWDYYKYSPTFSLLMAPLAYLPDGLGLFVWNALNVFVLFFALWKLPMQTDKKRLFTFGFILIELITSLQNSQSNGLMAGLLIFAFILLEKKQLHWASLLIVLSIFIKIFGLVAFALFLFYPNKLKSFLYTVGWVILIAILPLFVVSITQLTFLYQSWLALLQNDHSISLGFSVVGWLYSWFGVDAKNLVLVIGAVLCCLPLLNYKCFNSLPFKLYFLASLLIWVVIFNHKAESPTFIIAISGVAIWFFSQRLKTENLILILFAFVFTILSPTDLFPKNIRVHYIVPYVWKVVPCIFIWLKIIIDLLLFKPHDVSVISNESN